MLSFVRFAVMALAAAAGTEGKLRKTEGKPRKTEGKVEKPRKTEGEPINCGPKRLAFEKKEGNCECASDEKKKMKTKNGKWFCRPPFCGPLGNSRKDCTCNWQQYKRTRTGGKSYCTDPCWCHAKGVCKSDIDSCPNGPKRDGVFLFGTPAPTAMMDDPDDKKPVYWADTTMMDEPEDKKTQKPQDKKTQKPQDKESVDKLSSDKAEKQNGQNDGFVEKKGTKKDR